MTRQLTSAAMAAALCGSFAVSAAIAGDLDCAENGLMEFATWLEQVEALNPGIESLELFEPARGRMLSEIPCEPNARACPPDGVFALRCSGNPRVLIAYEKGGCAVFADTITVERFERIVAASVVCSAGAEGGGPVLPATD